MASFNVSEVQLIEKHETPLVMTSPFIKMQIDIEIHDFMYLVFKWPYDIVMVQNDFQQAKYSKTMWAKFDKNGERGK